MKRTERHHLKENELANVALSARRVLETQKSWVTVAGAAVVVVAVVAIGYRLWSGQSETRAQALLSEAVATEEAPVGPPPTPDTPQSGLHFATDHERLEATVTKLKAVSDRYPSSEAGIRARYQSAGVLLALGRPQEAVSAYQDVVSRAGSGIYGDTARLGLAEAQAQAGEHDKAIATFKELAERKDGSLPVEGILMQLGRTYRSAGRNDDAQQTFNRIVDEFPNSPFSVEAKQELESLKKT
jgi:TolA-binding protein